MANLILDFLHNYHTGERRETEPASTYQYDEGHVLEAIVPAQVTSCELQYWIRGMEEAECYTPTSITANADGSYTILGNIPNSYFMSYGELRVYIVVTDGDASITTYEGFIHIGQRSLPDDYVSGDPDNEATRVLTEAQEAATTATNAADRAETAAESIPADYSTLATQVSTNTSNITSLTQDLTMISDDALITSVSSQAYYHDVSPYRVNVYPNTYTTSLPFRYATSENIIADVLKTGTQHDITGTLTGRYTNLTGTGSGGYNLVNSPGATVYNALSGKTVNFYMYINKPSGWGNSSYFQIVVNGSTAYRVNFNSDNNNLIGWTAVEELEMPETVTALKIGFNSFNGTSFVSGDWIWCGIYESTLVNTEQIITDDPTTVTISDASCIDTAMHESTVTYLVDIQNYVDTHVPDIAGYWTEGIYILPEYFGAKGDGTTDDTQAITDAIAYAVSTGKAVRGFNSYLVSSTILMSARFLDVYLRDIIYTGSGAAVQLSHRDTKFEFHSITSSGIGILFEPYDSQPCGRHTVTGCYISSTSDCIKISDNAYYSTVNIRYLNSSSANCITFDFGTGNAAEFVFRDSTCVCPSGWVAYEPCGSKFYNFTVEANCLNGIYDPIDCVFIGFRHREQIDTVARRIIGSLVQDTTGPLFKFSTSVKANRFRYSTSDGIYWYSIDTSESGGYASFSGNTDNWQNSSLFCAEIDCPVKGSGQLTTSVNQYEMIASKVYIVGGNKVFVPYGRKTVTISDSTYDYRLFESMTDADIVSASGMHWGTDFIIDVASTTIYLTASHCAVGYNHLTVTQANGNVATIYDKQGNLLFDGASLGDGVYDLQCAMNGDSYGRYGGTSSVAWCYDGTNETWTITQIS